MISAPRHARTRATLAAEPQPAPDEPDGSLDPDRIADMVGRLTAEVGRLMEENGSLREAAELWIGLYESQLARSSSQRSWPARPGASVTRP